MLNVISSSCLRDSVVLNGFSGDAQLKKRHKTDECETIE